MGALQSHLVRALGLNLKRKHALQARSTPRSRAAWSRAVAIAPRGETSSFTVATSFHDHRRSTTKTQDKETALPPRPKGRGFLRRSTVKFACETCGGRGWFATSAVDAFPNPCPVLQGERVTLTSEERSRLLRHVLLGLSAIRNVRARPAQDSGGVAWRSVNLRARPARGPQALATERCPCLHVRALRASCRARRGKRDLELFASFRVQWGALVSSCSSTPCRRTCARKGEGASADLAKVQPILDRSEPASLG